MLLAYKHLLFIFLGALFLSIYADDADDQSGFISIDCGLPHGSSYEEQKTGLKYISDETFIDTGITRTIQPEYQEKYIRPGWSLRSFPEGNRNCYKIGVTSETKYLIRATFVYANYDGLDMPPAFDLYLGTDFWISIKFTSAMQDDVHAEIIHVPRQNQVDVCLAKTGNGTPFMTTLELRPLENVSYPVLNVGSLLKLLRLDAGSGTMYRYGEDSYDRVWNPFQPADTTTLNTSLLTSSNLTSNNFRPPPAVMTTASTPKNGDSLDFNWELSDDFSNTSQCYIYLHFTEVEKLKANESREFQIFHNGKLFYGPLSPLSSRTVTVYNQKSALSGRVHNFSISRTANSTLPPIINALEFYVVKDLLQSETDEVDGDAMRSIKSTYGMKRNWQGDPCLPRIYLWEGVDCSYDDDSQLQAPRVVSLNLSATGLVGDIPASISNLTMIQTLDLSNNNLTGSIPDFLTELPKMKILNLENNNLGGPIPAELVQKWKDGFLSISVCGNSNLSSMISCERKKKKNIVLPVAVSVVGALVIVLIVAAIWWVLTRKKQDAKSSSQDYGSLCARKQNFTYSEMVNITNNFERILGEGGFGKVYYGCINNTQVAVKTLSASSVQGFHQFQAEVNLLMRVHHKNLTSLVGYCNDKNNLALIYEYMANGNLEQHLSGSNLNILKWEDRLRIATDAAQGLEYLHYGCKPPIIHRDVKTTNILLNENLQAKLSDFGLSRIIPNANETHVSTVVAGTPGYLDPEYYMSSRLNEKSDVYSFGVVLLEIITGRPAISKFSEKTHVSEWVKMMLQKGNIKGIVDPKLEGNFNVNSAWKIVEIAMNCISQHSTERPTMSQVVGELKESLEIGLVRTRECLQSPGSRETAPMMPFMSINCSSEISTPSAR